MFTIAVLTFNGSRIDIGIVPQTVTKAPIDWSQDPYVQVEGGDHRGDGKQLTF